MNRKPVTRREIDDINGRIDFILETLGLQIALRWDDAFRANALAAMTQRPLRGSLSRGKRARSKMKLAQLLMKPIAPFPRESDDPAPAP